jgi:hypothetical protein
MTEIYKLVRAIQKGESQEALNIARKKPELLEEKIEGLSYSTPICIAADNKQYKLVLDLARINVKAMDTSCSSEDALLTILRKHGSEYDMLSGIAQINPKLVSPAILNVFIGRGELDHALEFAKLNPSVIETYSIYNGKPIDYAFQEGHTDLVDQLIGVLDQYNNEKHMEEL